MLMIIIKSLNPHYIDCIIVIFITEKSKMISTRDYDKYSYYQRKAS
jgi:hypothetical protein